ncbi:hypothetical protein chiPu_0016820 [Chiloscyllium punctatum]|uniref:Ig-like domain-containing protein n=1 Tax=Chiloscyllium punctatum TaxID=137246 RepID=A0A401T6M5_CHIPU|nr:hypothetical protein [Chiloscyllium punctatum]
MARSISSWERTLESLSSEAGQAGIRVSVVKGLRNTQSDSHRLQLYKAEPSEARDYQEPGTGTGVHTMISHIQLIWPLAFCVAGISGDIIMTQSPPSVVSGTGPDCNHHLYGQSKHQQREGTKLRLSRENSQPKLTLLPPSPEQVNAKGTATLVCLANHFCPDELEVQWKKDGTVISDGVQTSNYLRASDSTNSVSNLLTLSGSDSESNARLSCALTHVTLPSPLSKSIRRSECM